jgi:hypothetical protein
MTDLLGNNIARTVTEITERRELGGVSTGHQSRTGCGSSPKLPENAVRKARKGAMGRTGYFN